MAGINQSSIAERGLTLNVRADSATGTVSDDGTAQAGHKVTLFNKKTLTYAGSTASGADGVWLFRGFPIGTGDLVAIAEHPTDAEAIAAGVVAPFIPGEKPPFVNPSVVFFDGIFDGESEEPWTFPATGNRYTAAGFMSSAPPLTSHFIANAAGIFERTVRAPWGYAWETIYIIDGDAELLVEWQQGSLNSSTGDSGLLGIDLLDASGGVISNSESTAETYAARGVWNDRSMVLNVPPTAVAVRVYFNASGGNAACAAIRFTIQPRA